MSPDPGVMRKLRTNEGRLCTASLVWSEMRFGCNRLPVSKRRSEIERYLQDVLAPSLPVLPLDGRSAHWHGAERARLIAMGRTPSTVDGLIAAIASVNDLILVTANVDDFLEFQGLDIEDWRAQR